MEKKIIIDRYFRKRRHFGVFFFYPPKTVFKPLYMNNKTNIMDKELDKQIRCALVLANENWDKFEKMHHLFDEALIWILDPKIPISLSEDVFSSYAAMFFNLQELRSSVDSILEKCPYTTLSSLNKKLVDYFNYYYNRNLEQYGSRR